MSRSKPDKVFAIRDANLLHIAYVIARHGKGALTIARGLIAYLPKSAEAVEVSAEDMRHAINFSRKEG